MDVLTQREKILDYCKRNGSITVRDAYDMRINSPTKRISELNHDPGYIVSSQMEYRLDADGKVDERWKRYWIREVRE